MTELIAEGRRPVEIIQDFVTGLWTRKYPDGNRFEYAITNDEGKELCRTRLLNEVAAFVAGYREAQATFEQALKEEMKISAGRRITIWNMQGRAEKLEKTLDKLLMAAVDRKTTSSQWVLNMEEAIILSCEILGKKRP